MSCNNNIAKPNIKLTCAYSTCILGSGYNLSLLPLTDQK